MKVFKLADCWQVSLRYLSWIFWLQSFSRDLSRNVSVSFHSWRWSEYTSSGPPKISFFSSVLSSRCFPLLIQILRQGSYQWYQFLFPKFIFSSIKDNDLLSLKSLNDTLLWLFPSLKSVAKANTRPDRSVLQWFSATIWCNSLFSHLCTWANRNRPKKFQLSF